MKLFRLPPVGDRIPVNGLLKNTKLNELQLFQSYTPFYYDCGTSALATALLMVKNIANKTNSTDKNEVLVPAYGCPDVISAVVYAGLTPVLVDLDKELPYLSLASLKESITKQTLAVIAINFFGIQERLDEISSIVSKLDVAVIEDSAQRAPWKGKGRLYGDYVVLSFGRGKPESVLHGGAVLVKPSVLSKQHEEMIKCFDQGFEQNALLSQAIYGLKLIAYNLLLEPRLFWILYALPFLGVGETRYKPLTNTQGMAALAYRVLCYKIKHSSTKMSTNLGIRQYINQSAQKISQTSFVNLPHKCEVDLRQLLRYPVLLPGIKEKEIFLLRCENLGVSEMYPSVLPCIAGLDWLKSSKKIENATDFSHRLVTLPCHSGVKKEHVDQIFNELVLLGIK